MTVRLTPDQREAIAHDRRPYADIASAYGITRPRVSTIKQRAGTAASRPGASRHQKGKTAPAAPVPVRSDRHYSRAWE